MTWLKDAPALQKAAEAPFSRYQQLGSERSALDIIADTSHDRYHEMLNGKIEKARVFRNGRSQAVRIPAEYRFKSDEVYIRQDPHTGDLTLSERPPTLSLDEIYAELDAAGAADFVLHRDSAPPVEREWM